MRIIYPEGTEALLEVCAKHGAEKVWHKLANGALQAFHYATHNGAVRAIPSQEWRKHPQVIEQGGHVVRLHPVELIERGDLSWIGAYEVAGKRIRAGIENDPVLIERDQVQELFPRVRVDGDKGGRPEHPAKAWYCAKGYSRGGLSLGELQTEMKNATGIEPPSKSAIRQWEKEAQKPPTET